MRIPQTCILTLCLTGFCLTTCKADLVFYSDSGTFSAAIPSATFLGTEDFEGIDGTAIGQFDNPVAFNGPLSDSSTTSPFPSGLTVPMTIQPSSGQLEAHRERTYAGGSGPSSFVYRFTSAVVLPESRFESLDLIFDASDNVTAVSLSPKAFSVPTVPVTFEIFDTSGTSLGMTVVDTNTGFSISGGSDISANPFLGIVSTSVVIGRINISNGSREVGADDISLYSNFATPEPGSLVLLLSSVAAFSLGRRRR